MMSYEEFCEFAKEEVQRLCEASGITCRAELNYSPEKNVDCRVILKGYSRNFVPAIRMPVCYALYRGGRDAENVISEVWDNLMKTTEPMRPGFELSYDSIKDRLFIKVCSRERNEAMLNRVPHRVFGDLAITYHILFSKDGESVASAAVNRSLMNVLCISPDELHRQAVKSSVRLMPAKIMTPSEWMKTPMQIAPFLALSNDLRCYGAAVMFYPGVLEETGRMLNDDFYIIPTSIHEVLACPCASYGDLRFLREMLKDGNRLTVGPDEILSEQIYQYSLSDKTLKPADEADPYPGTGHLLS